MTLDNFSTKVLQNIRLIATDMDGTITDDGKFTAELIPALTRLQNHNIKLVIVTGRSAGWVNGLANYLPIDGAIAENGGIFYDKNNSWEFLTEIKDIARHRQKLTEIFQLLQDSFPQIQESQDNLFRLTDWTFDIGTLSDLQLQKMNRICLENGWGFTYSTVQCHIKPLEQDKAQGLNKVLKQYFPQLSSKQIVTVGDSPNDESLFNSEFFPISIGVSNIKDYLEVLNHKPRYITSKPEIAGFLELINRIINSPSS